MIAAAHLNTLLQQFDSLSATIPRILSESESRTRRKAVKPRIRRPVSSRTAKKRKAA